MKKKSTASSPPGKQIRRKKKYMHDGDDDIDYSDIPALTDGQLKGMVRLGRPLIGEVARQMIAIRIDPTILEKLKKLAQKAGKGYQTLINEVLAEYINKKKSA